MSTTPVSSPRANSAPLAYLAPSSARVISNLARDRLKSLPSVALSLSAPPFELDMYYIALAAAIGLFKEGKVDEAREMFGEAIDGLPKTDDLKLKYARAVGWINFAATYEVGSEERNNKALLAQPIIFEIYDIATTLPAANTDIADLYEDHAYPIRVLLNELSQMLTDKTSFTYNALMGKIGTMNDLHGELPASTLLEGFPSREVSPETSPRVTKGPVEESWKTPKLVFAFSIASLVIAVSVFAIYRSVTKIN